jgi:hypothetical protein
MWLVRVENDGTSRKNLLTCNRVFNKIKTVEGCMWEETEKANRRPKLFEAFA